MSDENNLVKAMDKYGDMLFRYCLFALCNNSDAEDAVQEIFLIYFRKAPDFSDSEHEKAWLIRVAVNKCHDIRRYQKRHLTEPVELLRNVAVPEKDNYILEALLEVPEKFRLPLELHYIEGFKVDEIAKLIGATRSTVKMRLSKGRKLLKEAYGRE